MAPGNGVGELHVLPHEHSGRWLVGVEDGGPPLSWHGTAGEAQSAAQRVAGDRRIFLHDRYRRVRSVRTPARPAPPPGAA